MASTKWFKISLIQLYYNSHLRKIVFQTYVQIKKNYFKILKKLRKRETV